MSDTFISIAEFTKLMRDAEKAERTGDTHALIKINERIRQVGYELVVRDGKLHIRAVTNE